jgi:hypothetical protein
VITARHGDDTVLLNAQTGRYHTLNPTGSEIWELLCERVTPIEIARRLQTRYQLSEAVACHEVLQLLRQCAAASLFEEVWS